LEVDLKNPTHLQEIPTDDSGCCATELLFLNNNDDVF
jgi:hypothetical protein